LDKDNVRAVAIAGLSRERVEEKEGGNGNETR
jgi:hypothetical protein